MLYARANTVALKCVLGDQITRIETQQRHVAIYPHVYQAVVGRQGQQVLLFTDVLFNGYSFSRICIKLLQLVYSHFIAFSWIVLLSVAYVYVRSFNPIIFQP